MVCLINDFERVCIYRCVRACGGVKVNERVHLWRGDRDLKKWYIDKTGSCVCFPRGDRAISSQLKILSGVYVRLWFKADKGFVSTLVLTRYHA